MLYKKNCYIYLVARAGISHREDFRIKDTSFDSLQNSFKSKYVGV